MDKAAIETQIRDVLNSETDAIVLSNKLFNPNGLFNQLAKSKTERESLAQSALFKKAQQRLAELRRKEAREFSKTTEKTDSLLNGARFHRLEGV